MKILYVSSNDTFSKIKQILMLVLGLHSKDRKSTRNKANISNPKVNRGCLPLIANRISADCVQISLRPSIQYIPLRVYHTGGFNAMFRTKASDVKLWYFLWSAPEPTVEQTQETPVIWDTIALNITSLSWKNGIWFTKRKSNSFMKNIIKTCCVI